MTAQLKTPMQGGQDTDHFILMEMNALSDSQFKQDSQIMALKSLRTHFAAAVGERSDVPLFAQFLTLVDAKIAYHEDPSTDNASKLISAYDNFIRTYDDCDDNQPHIRNALFNEVGRSIVKTRDEAFKNNTILEAIRKTTNLNFSAEFSI